MSDVPEIKPAKAALGFANEFKAFIMRGNVVDLAVGVIIGAAFSKIVDAIVVHLFTPFIGMFIGGYDFTSLSITLYRDAQLGIGHVIQTVLNFVIIGFSLFLVVKGMNRLERKKEEAAKPAELSSTDKLLIEIRDELRRKG